MAKKQTQLKAFTLAEVLITLGVIGIIATMTIPQLIQKQNEVTLVNQLKKTHSVLSQAVLLAFNDNTQELNSMLIASSSKALASVEMMNYFLPYLKVDKICGINAGMGCFAKDVTYKRLRGVDYSKLDDLVDRSKIKLSDGTAITFYTWGNLGCTYTKGDLLNVCGQFYVDINGDKGPNTQGIDYFSFYFTEKKVVPEGANGDIASMVASDCLIKTTASGWNCATWVLYKENLDYLHCDDLNWNTKAKCD